MSDFPKTGPKVTSEWIAPDAKTEVPDELDKFINEVNTLRRAPSILNELLPSTTLLLKHMFPADAAKNNLDLVYLSNWKEYYKNSMKQADLQAAFNKMGFEVSKHLGSLMALFQITSGGTIDYNSFIQCCAIVEKHGQKISGSSGGQMKNPNASASAIPPKK